MGSRGLAWIGNLRRQPRLSTGQVVALVAAWQCPPVSSRGSSQPPIPGASPGRGLVGSHANRHPSPTRPLESVHVEPSRSPCHLAGCRTRRHRRHHFHHLHSAQCLRLGNHRPTGCRPQPGIARRRHRQSGRGMCRGHAWISITHVFQTRLRSRCPHPHFRNHRRQPLRSCPARRPSDSLPRSQIRPRLHPLQSGT